MTKLYVHLTALVVPAVLFFCGLARAEDLFYCNQGLIAEDKGDLERAVSSFTHCLDEGSLTQENLAVGHYNRGNIYLRTDRLDEAIEDYNAALSLRPNYVDALNNRGRSHTKLGAYERAIEDLDRSIELKPDGPVAFNYRGNAYFAQELYESAFHDYSEAIRLRPRYANALYNRGLALQTVGLHDQAILDFDECIHNEPENDSAYYNRGLSYLKKGSYDQAIDDFGRAIELNPRLINVYLDRAIAYHRSNLYENAIQDYESAIQASSNSIHALNLKAWLLATALDGRYRDGEEAVNLARRALQLEDSANNQDTLAAALAEKGQFSEAVLEQERAIELLQAEGWSADDISAAVYRLRLYEQGKPYRED